MRNKYYYCHFWAALNDTPEYMVDEDVKRIQKALLGRVEDQLIKLSSLNIQTLKR